MEKQLRAYVHASSFFTSHLGKTNDVQIMNQLLAYVSAYVREDCLMSFYHREQCLVWFGLVNDYKL